MTLDELKECFENYEEQEFLEFDAIVNPKSKRPDLCAFMLLDAALPGTTDIISASEHDEIYLDVTVEDLAKVATDDLVRDLVRCGVRYNQNLDSLEMFT